MESHVGTTLRRRGGGRELVAHVECLPVCCCVSPAVCKFSHSLILGYVVSVSVLWLMCLFMLGGMFMIDLIVIV